MHPKGLVTVSSVVDADGNPVSLQKAVEYGWIIPACGPATPRGWGITPKTEISLGHNLFVDQGRQVVAFLLGFRAPVSNWAIQQFGVGTGTGTPTVSDVALQSPITLASTSSTTAPILGVDFLTPFVLRISYQIALGDANGYLITERGLFTGNGTLVARHVSAAGINKTSDFSPVLTWRVRT